MSWYISELALYHKEFIPVRPSVMARSSLALARCILNREQPRFTAWSAQYDPQVVLNLSNHLGQPSQALLRKYSSMHLSSVSTTIEMFLARQAAIASRIVQTPAGELANLDVSQIQPANNTYLTPQTPQKPGYHHFPTGILTPPITPDKDYVESAYPPPQHLLPRMPCTPTPPPSAEQHPPQQQMSLAQQQFQQYMQAPQYA
jgi:hypothetical protein